MSNVIQFGRKESSVQELLNDASDKCLASVVLVGTDAQGLVHFAHTAPESMVQLIGAVEAAKMHLYDTW